WTASASAPASAGRRRSEGGEEGVSQSRQDRKEGRSEEEQEEQGRRTITRGFRLVFLFFLCELGGFARDFFLSYFGATMPLSDLQKLTDEKWVNLFAVRYERDGHSSRWVFASRKQQPLTGVLASDAVLIVPVLRNPGEPARLVLVREFRVPVGR